MDEKLKKVGNNVAFTERTHISKRGKHYKRRHKMRLLGKGQYIPEKEFKDGSQGE